LVTRVWPTRHFFECSRITSRILTASRTGPMIVAASLSIHILAVAVAWSVARAIAAPADFWQLLQLVPIVMLITVIPISIAGWGLREASMGLAFGYAGIGASEGVNVSLLFGAVYFVVGALGGLIWILSAEKAAKGDAPIDVPE
ncbi:lysylphosphatidylglycerol synthase domain-containing protein, partial [Rhodopseudomonas sp. B29]|uniref:lysylphosphatidylglycerol synthase domain-containing protein n=1 Tax=Rhodopseudomonas sp. B29 TaxID=95607 RepID=UPI0004CFD58D